jgi:hypothetical protein
MNTVFGWGPGLCDLKQVVLSGGAIYTGVVARASSRHAQGPVTFTAVSGGISVGHPEPQIPQIMTRAVTGGLGWRPSTASAPAASPPPAPQAPGPSREAAPSAQPRPGPGPVDVPPGAAPASVSSTSRGSTTASASGGTVVSALALLDTLTALGVPESAQDDVAAIIGRSRTVPASQLSDILRRAGIGAATVMRVELQLVGPYVRCDGDAILHNLNADDCQPEWSPAMAKVRHHGAEVLLEIPPSCHRT